MKICLIIPTLNEETNILKIFQKIRNTKIKLDILFIDDNSTDESQKIIINLKKKYNFVKYIFRNKKIGIGSAHKDGIKYAYKKKLPISENNLEKLYSKWTPYNTIATWYLWRSLDPLPISY